MQKQVFFLKYFHVRSPPSHPGGGSKPQVNVIASPVFCANLLPELESHSVMFYICLQESIDFPVIVKIIVKPQLKSNHLSTWSIHLNSQNNLVLSLIAADLFTLRIDLVIWYARNDFTECMKNRFLYKKKIFINYALLY